jgi:hypothetical protein
MLTISEPARQIQPGFFLLYCPKMTLSHAILKFIKITNKPEICHGGWDWHD